jgi:hypothetical protein
MIGRTLGGHVEQENIIAANRRTEENDDRVGHHQVKLVQR